MLVKALDLASPEDSKLIVKYINSTNVNKKISVIKDIYERYNIANLVQEQIKSHLENFQKSILKINSSRASQLLEFVSSITNRNT